MPFGLKKTNFLEAIKNFRPSIGSIIIVLFEFCTLAGSQNWKKSYADAKEEPVYLNDIVDESWSYCMTRPIKTN